MSAVDITSKILAEGSGVGKRTAGPSAPRLMTKKDCVECCGLPLKPKPGLTPISCHAALERPACAPFI